MADEAHANRSYWVVYVALLLLLVATVGFSFIDFGHHLSIVVAMAIALAKGVLIVLFFMHMRWRPWLTWFFAGAGFLWLGILFVLTASDYLTRNHPPHNGPKGEPVFLTPYR